MGMLLLIYIPAHAYKNVLSLIYSMEPTCVYPSSWPQALIYTKEPTHGYPSNNKS